MDVTFACTCGTALVEATTDADEYDATLACPECREQFVLTVTRLPDPTVGRPAARD